MLLHRVLFISPYRCYDCDDRHYRFRFPRAIPRGLRASTPSVARASRLP